MEFLHEHSFGLIEQIEKIDEGPTGFNGERTIMSPSIEQGERRTMIVREPAKGNMLKSNSTLRHRKAACHASWWPNDGFQKYRPRFQCSGNSLYDESTSSFVVRSKASIILR